MQIILLSGGSGTRLWPLSNDARSKQFLRLLDSEISGERESMVQRVMRQIRKSGMDAEIIVATSSSQVDSVISQLGDNVEIVAEPSRRDTFPAICLACEYLAREKKCGKDEVVVVMPCDPYTEDEYFSTIMKMASGVETTEMDMIVMGIAPTYPSSKYGYIVPDYEEKEGDVFRVRRFTEKPDVATAEALIAEGARWNGGVFAFKLGYIIDIAEKYVRGETFEGIRNCYEEFPKISFDYEVAEKARNVGVVEYNGEWKDLGTWNTLTDELKAKTYGNVIVDDTSDNTHLFNELEIPMLCIGTKDLVVAASPDGIIISEKCKSEKVKKFAEKIKMRPMYEERRWGTYKVIDYMVFPDGYCALTKQLTLNPGAYISYKKHAYRDEVWTFIDGEGEIVIDGNRGKIKRGETVAIPKGVMHTLKATTSLTFIEVQSGSCLMEEDIERVQFEW